MSFINEITNIDNYLFRDFLCIVRVRIFIDPSIRIDGVGPKGVSEESTQLLC